MVIGLDNPLAFVATSAVVALVAKSALVAVSALVAWSASLAWSDSLESSAWTSVISIFASLEPSVATFPTALPLSDRLIALANAFALAATSTVPVTPTVILSLLESVVKEIFLPAFIDKVSCLLSACKVTVPTLTFAKAFWLTSAPVATVSSLPLSSLLK